MSESDDTNDVANNVDNNPTLETETKYQDPETKTINITEVAQSNMLNDLSKTIIVQTKRFNDIDSRFQSSDAKITQMERSIVDLNNSIQAMLGMQQTGNSTFNTSNTNIFATPSLNTTSPLNANANTFLPQNAASSSIPRSPFNSRSSPDPVEETIVKMFHEASQQNFKLKRIETNTTEIQKALHKSN